MADDEHGSEAAPRLWRMGSVTFDEVSRELRVSGVVRRIETVPLALLLRLMVADGHFVSKGVLTEAGWGHGQASDESIMTAIAKIRSALGPGERGLIVVKRGQGYRLTRPVSSEPSPVNRSTVGFVADEPVPGRPGWRLVSPLGNGRANDVWRAVHDGTGERRVMKFAEDGGRVDGLRREVQLSRALREAYPDDDGFVLVLDADTEAVPARLESADGGLDLIAWAKAQGGLAALPLEARLGLVAEVAQTLARAHAVGVVHGDLHPGNILVREVADGWCEQGSRISAPEG